MVYDRGMPAVSVLMPCLNAEATLGEALESLAAQTLADVEVVAVDDGSTDATAAILAARAAADPRVRVLRRARRGGIVAALNEGLAACRAPLVARMDADDVAHPERLARQAAHLNAHPETALVACRVEAFPAEAVREGLALYLDWMNGLLTDADLRREMFVESPLPHPGVVIRRPWLDRVGGYRDMGWAEDYDLWLRLMLAGARFAKLPETLLRWRERPDRLTRSDPRYAPESFRRAKAHFLAAGPLRGRDALYIWGAGDLGPKIARHLEEEGIVPEAFVDIDPLKIGRTRRGRPVVAPAALAGRLAGHASPALLAAVGSRGAREIVRRRIAAAAPGLVEGRDWWAVA